MIQALNNENYDEIVRNNDKIVIKFYADWCGDCRRIMQKYEELATLHNTIVFASVDIEKEATLKEKLGITSIPDVRFFSDGQEVNKLVEMSPAALEEAVESFS